jgi:hypothetical protein
MTPAADDDPKRLSDSLAKEADELERDSSELEGQIQATRDDWEHKRRDDGVPGAQPPDDPAAGEEPPEASAKG